MEREDVYLKRRSSWSGYGLSPSTCPRYTITPTHRTEWQSSKPSSPPRSTTSVRTSPSTTSHAIPSTPTDSCSPRCLPRRQTSAPAALPFPSFARSNRTPRQSSVRTLNSTPCRPHHIRSFPRYHDARRLPFPSQTRFHATFSTVLREGTPTVLKF